MFSQCKAKMLSLPRETLILTLSTCSFSCVIWQSANHLLDVIPDPSLPENVITNPLFDAGLSHWSARGCHIELCDSTISDSILPSTGRFFAKSMQREHESSGIQQDITGKVWKGIPYQLFAVVQISGSGSEVIHADVQAILRIKTVHGSIQHVPVAKSVSSGHKSSKYMSYIMNGFSFLMIYWWKLQKKKR